MDYEEINFIIKQFIIDTKVLKIEEIHSGHINRTYKVEHLYNGKISRFILQKLSDIFDSGEILNINHELITKHIDNKVKSNNLIISKKRWETPKLIKCKSNNLNSFIYKSSYWRAMVYIDDTFSLDLIEDEIMAYETGVGLAKFHFVCSDLDFSKIVKSIENFHNTKFYLDKYILSLKDFDFEILNNNSKRRLQSLISEISNHIDYIELLIASLKKKSITSNVIHGDPKLSNFLFDIQNKYVVSLIDLDTVSSGHLLTDLADCIRSICNRSGEESKKLESVCFDVNTLKYFLEGYFSINHNQNDYSFQFLPEFIYVTIFELSIRFLTDFLQSNSYFKIEYETHNLFRSEVQFRLLSSFLSQISNLSKVLKEIGISYSPTFVSDVRKLI
tara:strand:- start:247 stop:1410 length:1164 start_codon:yes stop_codon:yes gene_type:complete